jgi:hypothetical protein
MQNKGKQSDTILLTTAVGVQQAFAFSVALVLNELSACECMAGAGTLLQYASAHRGT